MKNCKSHCITVSLYQIIRDCQCLNDVRIRIYDLGTLTTWLYKLETKECIICIIG